MAPEELEKTTVEITALDLSKKILTGKDKLNVVHVFHYDDRTKLRQVESSSQPLAVSGYILARRPLPLRLTQDVLVKWKLDETQKMRLAIEIVTLD